MAQVTVIEIEEGALTCTVATVGRRAICIGACLQLPLTEPTAANIAGCLRAAAERIGPLGAVHIVVGDRRIQHFTVRVPRLDPAELVAFVQRETARQGGLAPGTELVGQARVLAQLGGAMQRVGVVAAPKAVLTPIERGCEEAAVEILTLSSVESCIAGVLDRRSAERTAVVDFAAGRARFLVYEHGMLSHLRRFLVHGVVSEAGSQALLIGQLAMELPRTLAYLREQGCEPPTELLVGHQIQAGDDLLALTDESITSVRAYAPTARIAEGEAVPGLPTLGLLNLVQAGRAVLSLRDGLKVRLPRSPLRIAAAAALLAVAAGGIATGVARLGPVADLAAQLRLAEQELVDVERLMAQRLLPAPTVETADPEHERAQAILARRRPVSMAVARIGGLSREHTQVGSLTFAAGDRIEVAGAATAPDRLTALRSIGEFGEALAGIPFLQRIGAEELRDDDEVAGRIHFRFELTWRHP